MRWLLPSMFASMFALATTACVPEVAPPPNTPDPGHAKPAADPADAFKIEGSLRDEVFPLLKAPVVNAAKARLDAPPPGLPAPPVSCGAFVNRKGAGAAKCADGPSALAALDAALGVDDPGARDAALVALEACAGLPGGAVRALRMELAPTECGDAIAEPWLKAPPPGSNGHMHYAILGQAVAARLSRAATNPPELARPYDRKRVQEFIKGQMRAWFDEQARVIEAVSRDAAELPGYAKGVAAVESGIADMRLVEAARGAPIPDEFARDQELKNTYYASLDQWLDPRKDRGRDAALVGLKELAIAGVIQDGRVNRARVLLSRLYGGRRIDALDALIMPPIEKGSPSSVEERLAGKLPAMYAGIILDEQAATRPGTLRMMLGRGLPQPQRAALKTAALSPEVRALYARGRIEIARLYVRAIDVDQALSVLAAQKDAPLGDDATFLLALGIALRNGPEDATDMMRKAPRALALGQIGALDAIAHKARAEKWAGAAAFDAALIRQISAPEGADAVYWSDVAKRFREAAGLLADPAQRALAEDRAKAALAIADAAGPIVEAPSPPKK